MVHDSDDLDMWYHDTISQFSHLITRSQLVIHMLQRPEKYSNQDCIDKLEGMKEFYGKGKAMMYEHYLEQQRLRKVKDNGL